MNTLQYVRPGNGWKPKKSMTFFTKNHVNGKSQQPLYGWLKAEIMMPLDPAVLSHPGEYAADHDLLIAFRSAYDFTTTSLWTPVCRSDIAWNFEYFLVGKDGRPLQRFGRYHGAEKVAPYIDKALAM